MKINKLVLVVVILTGIAAGIVIKSKVDYLEQNSISEIENKSDMLKMVKEQIAVNNEIISDLKEKYEKNQLLVDKDEYEKYLNDEIQKLKEFSGFTDLYGEGIEITLSDSKDKLLGNTNFGIVHDIDIMNILNDLKISGAEAISINGIRISENTDVKCGGSVVRIDGVPKAIPFVIRAIGDKEKLYAGLYDMSGYLKILENVYKVDVSIIKKERINIPKRVM